jgi:acyl-CoA synthetase (NDP forming)
MLTELLREKEQMVTHLETSNVKHKALINALKEMLFKKQEEMLVIKECWVKAESHLIDVKHKLNQQCLEVHELQLQLITCEELITETLIKAEV